MNLYFLRHAKACARSRKWRPDGTRPLTRDGEKKMFEIAKGIRNLELPLDLILTSPFLRAFRTAEILAEVLGSKKMVETKNLIPEAGLEKIIEEIKANHPSASDIVLVGHEPFLGRLISFLLTGRETMSVELRKGGWCHLAIGKLQPDQCAALESLMTPRQLAGLVKK